MRDKVRRAAKLYHLNGKLSPNGLPLGGLESRCKRQYHRKDQDDGKDDDQNLQRPVRGRFGLFWFDLIFVF